jgi:hypothetical protein
MPLSVLPAAAADDDDDNDHDDDHVDCNLDDTSYNAENNWKVIR